MCAQYNGGRLTEERIVEMLQIQPFAIVKWMNFWGKKEQIDWHSQQLLNSNSDCEPFWTIKLSIDIARMVNEIEHVSQIKIIG